METPNTMKSPPKKNGRLAWLLAGVIVVAFAWRVSSIARSSHSPFSDKDKVLASVPWRIPTSKGEYSNEDNYTWQDNETIIYAQRDEKQKYYLMRQRVRGGNVSAAQPLPDVEYPSFPLQLNASPNGKWLLVTSFGQHGYTEYTVIDLDNGTVIQKYQNRNSFMTWMQDSRSFVSITNVRSKFMQYWLTASTLKLRTLQQRYGDDAIISPQGTFFIGYFQLGSPPIPQLESGTIFTGKSQVHSIPRYGLDMVSKLASVSPTGERLLWFQFSSETSWWSELWGNLTKRGAIPNNHRAWYITDVNGNNPRMWTSMHWQGEKYAPEQGTAVQPKWLPDGKHLSVVYKGALYVVDVP